MLEEKEMYMAFSIYTVHAKYYISLLGVRLIFYIFVD
jgi:hypothetical protein